MVLPEHQNLWRQTATDRASSRAVASAQVADLLIIGGGFTGCSAALAAAEAGASVLLLDAQTVGHGGSGRNVGLVNAGLWLPPNKILAQMGEDAGRVLIDALSTAPATVFDLIKTHGIDCEANHTGTLHLAHSPVGQKSLQDRFQQGNAFGASLQLLDAAQTRARTGSAQYYGSLYDPRAGHRATTVILPWLSCRSRNGRRGDLR